MYWWAWIAVGAVLFGAELAFVDAQFYLVFVGAAALITGSLRLLGFDLAVWLQWLIFAILAVVSMLFFRRRIYGRMRGSLPAMRTGPAGETLTIGVALQPGEGCRLEFRGSSWSALNEGAVPIAAGARARIARVDGLTLILHAEP